MSHSRLYQAFITLAFLTLTAWFCISFTQKIKLLTADVGRHIQNGEILRHGSPAERSAILHANFYSYTHPDYPFINHHWLGSTLIYLAYTCAGFEGLSIFHTGITLLALGVFYILSHKRSGAIPTLFSIAFLMPLLTYRAEVRPECITLLLSGIFFLILYQYSTNRIGTRWLCILPILQLIWVNSHLGFIFSFVITGAFILEAFFKKFFSKKNHDPDKPSTIKPLAIVGLSLILVSLANPSGVMGAVYPFRIFQYEYKVLENQSIQTLLASDQQKTLGNVIFVIEYYKVALFILLLTGGIILFRKRRWPVLFSHLFVLSIFMSMLGASANRHIALCGFFLIPLAALIFKNFFEVLERSWSKMKYLTAIMIVLISSTGSSLAVHGGMQPKGIGIIPWMQNSIKFYKENHLHGPIFNNYDIGGYLIFNLPTTDKVYIDNRPEAYPPDFISKEYILPQQDAFEWVKLDKKYQFNTIYWYHRDLTSWSRTFLRMRIQDPHWALVFADPLVMIFVKKNPENQELISRTAIPPSRFGL